MPDMKITFPCTKELDMLLRKLVATGLYGATRDDAAQRLVERGVGDACQALKIPIHRP